jgi:hypothetical protein
VSSTIAAIAVSLMLACGGAAPVPPPEQLPPYTGQEQCDCRDLGSVRSRPHLLDLRCEAFWGCGLDADGQSCRQVCGWVPLVDGGVP